MEVKMDIQEIIKRHVLPYLPAKSLYKFRSVSKNWNKWITSHFFSHQQSNFFTKISGFFFQTHPYTQPTFISLNHSIYGVPRPSLDFLPGSIAIRTSSNGLLCCDSLFLGSESYFICNPVTSEWIELPEPKLHHGLESAIALVFQPSPFNFEAHFELVCAIPHDCFVSFEIYSSRTNSWRVSESEYYYSEENGFRFNGDGFFMKGFVYWETLNGIVLAFNLQDEQYGELPLPARDGLSMAGVLTEMHGELCYIIPSKNENENENEKENDEYLVEVYGDHNMELKRKISIDFGGLGEKIYGRFRVLGFVNDDLLVFIMGRNVIVYHVEERVAEIAMDPNAIVAEGRFGRYLPYVNSLVSVCPVEKMPSEETFG